MHNTFDNDNSKLSWERRFSENGNWEQSNGREQTRKFAEYFVRRARVDRGIESLLDVGCALGDAAPVLHSAYPWIKLQGCDFSENSIQRCRERYGAISEFFVSSLENISGDWDAIFCSNVLEHFENYLLVAEGLLRHCRVLYIMTPYNELRNGEPIIAAEGYEHKVTIIGNSFDYLLESEKASSIKTDIFECPGAWGWGLKRKLLHLAYNIKHGKSWKEASCFPRQILFTISRSS